MEKKSNRIDYAFWFCVMLLVSVGILMSLSSTYVNYGFAFFKKHFIYACAGFLFMTVLSFIDYKIFRKFVLIIFISALVLLALAAFAGTSAGDVKGAARWVKIGPIRFQPSELAKYAYILFLANYFYKHQDKKDSLIRFIIIPLVIVVPMLGLIYLQPNFSAVVLLSCVALAMMFIAGVKIRNMIYIGLTAIPIGAIALVVRGGYRVGRITTFFDPWKDIRGGGYQITQSFLAFCSGGFFGSGLGESKQKLAYLPEAHNDFIFAIFAEEVGFLGIALLFGLFIFMIYRGMRISIKTNDLFGKYLVFGIMSLIAFQVILNLFVVTGLFPVTGVPLPFVSYGGTALVAFMSLIGIVLNVSKGVEK